MFRFFIKNPREGAKGKGGKKADESVPGIGEIFLEIRQKLKKTYIFFR